MNLVKFILLLLMLTSCSEKKSEKKERKNSKHEFFSSKYFDADRVEKDKYNVKYKGDKLSYSELVLYYSYNKSKKLELLPYSIIMIEKYKQYDICTDAFDNLIEFYTEKESLFDGTHKSLINEYRRIETLDNDQQSFCLYFIKVGAKNNDYGSMKCLEVLYREGIGVNRDIIIADSIKSKIDSIETYKRRR